MTISDRRTAPEPPRPLPLHCVVGATLCHVFILDGAQWDAIPVRQRRRMAAEYMPGLGWVVASPGRLE